ncbi:response regulator transcription factor [Methylobacterium oxalidis]|uniref:DNA-binding response regulator n=1 Tax=Methylobacterium oxalidis TaxID=944322 RepID=A0A512JAS4_9HYPH|nr:response regulator transcription factor [Methylobacterium oxalidis]GEP07074.1 DNA-binding response regulator [Methylobacterium oxalidis]GJE33892.1 Response regulator UvrY [Methylobacterium oxalidis]GLS66420.1 DNA-binding response regulator [Methylobacterium oxalidis]
MTGVLIVDDHPIVRQGFRRVVEDAGVEVIFEAEDPVAGYRLFHRIRPRVSVVDLAFRGSGLAGVSLIRRMRTLEPEACILAFSMHHDPVIASRVLQAGASGYVLKDSPVHEIREAFEAVRRGRSYLPHALALAITQHITFSNRAKTADLSAREFQILILLGEGKSYGFIADTLSMSYRSVVNACASIRSKLGVRGQAQVLSEALKLTSV